MVEHMKPQFITGTVQEVGASGSGNKKIRIDGEWYQSGNRVDLSTITVGMSLFIEFHTYPYRNVTYRSVDAWTPAPTGSAGPMIPAPVTLGAPPVPAATVDRTPANNLIPFADADAKMRFVSGLTQSAVQAGLVKTPKEAEYWFKQACQIVHGQELLDEEIPFSILLPIGVAVGWAAYAAEAMFQVLGA